MRLTKPTDCLRFSRAKITPYRRTVGTRRTALSQGAAQAQRRQAPRARPRHAPGILFVLETDIPVQMLPQEMGCSYGRQRRRPTRGEAHCSQPLRLEDVQGVGGRQESIQQPRGRARKRPREAARR